MAIKHGRLLGFRLDSSGSGTIASTGAYVMEVNGIPGELELGDVTVGGATGHKFFPGLQKASFSVKMVGDMSSTAGGYFTVKGFQQDITTRSFEFAPAGTTAGYPLYTGECWIKSIDFPVKATDVLTFTVNCELDDALTLGINT